MFTWNQQQENALLKVKQWMAAGGKGVFRLFGFAGTGKTTLAKFFAQDYALGDVIYAAYTGKAAYVLQSKGCMGATTLHRLIYKPADKSTARVKEIKKAMEALEAELKTRGLTEETFKQDAEWRDLHEEYEQEKAAHKRLSFVLNPESALKDAKLLIVDEVSMVDAVMGHDLESFNVPILVLGDPAQLPPVMGASYFTKQTPDILLTDVQRQAKDNPIIRLATDVREGRTLRLGDYKWDGPTSKVITRAQVDRDELLAYDQLLVGRNATRAASNKRMRQLRGLDGPMPVPGDRLVCLRNNHEIGLLNGGLWTTQYSAQADQDTIDLQIRSEDSDLTITTSAHCAYFLGKEPPFWAVKERDCFDYGYALTVHKSQGSQWNRVYVFDESKCFRQDAKRWLYTAITRAAEQVVIVQDM